MSLWLADCETSDAGATTAVVRLIAHVMYIRLDVVCGGCGCGGSRQSSGVARWWLLTRRAWHGWCVADVAVALPGARRLVARSFHMYCFGGNGVVRRVRVLESFVVPRCVTSGQSLTVAGFPRRGVAVHVLGRVHLWKRCHIGYLWCLPV